MEKIKLNQIVIVEGKYDAIKLDSFLDALIIPVNGFSIFTDDDKKELIKNLGIKNGIILLTDSDTAGFKIRTYIQNICSNAIIYNVYIPNIKGKEHRKNAPSKEGYLGVEGIDKRTLIKCLESAGVFASNASINKSDLSYADLYELGLSGTQNSSVNRKILCKELNIPFKLSKKAFLEVLNRITTINEIQKILKTKVICWDFHGTLTIPDNQWIDAAVMLCGEHFSDMNISNNSIIENLGGKCLPWWTFPDRDTRHLIENDGWWNSCNQEFIQMFLNSGLTLSQAEKISPLIRNYVTDYKNHKLFPKAKEVLSILKDRGYINILVSNNFPELDEIIVDLGINDLFEHKVISAKVGYDKPRKEIFDYARNMLSNDINMLDIYMVGDNPIDDMKGAKACGFKTIYLNSQNKEYDINDVDFICTEITEILDILI